MTDTFSKPFLLASLVLAGMTSGCGGGGGGVSSTPTAPGGGSSGTPTVTYDTAEYRASDGPVAHGALSVYQAGISGEGVTVGIIDSGIAQSSSEFSGRISSASAAFGGNSSIEDQGGHGTAVASVLAGARNNANTLGMAWGATIMALRTDSPGSCAGSSANDNTCSHTFSAIANALDHARINGAKVVNISLGGSSGASTDLRAAVNRATQAGVIIVVSAGNAATGQTASASPSGFAASLADPAIARGLVIIAGSSNADGSHSSFSFGAAGYEAATLTALGVDVSAQDHTGAQFSYSGTSFSAPQIAGAIALLADAFPNMTSAEIVARLFDTATDAGATGDDAIFGQGVLNVARAYAPAGSTSLAGSTIAISTVSNGTLSPAMGDAAGGQSARAVAIDAIGRAYAINIAATLALAPRGPALAAQMSGQQRDIALSRGPFALQLHYAPAQDADGRRAHRATSGSFLTRIDTRRALGFAFGMGAHDLTARLTGATGDGAFLVTADGRTASGFGATAGRAMAMTQSLGNRWSLHGAAESGTIMRDDVAARANVRPDPYARMTLGAMWQGGNARLALGVEHLKEGETVLGGRLGPATGITGSTSQFLDIRGQIAPLHGWSINGAVRFGRTRGHGADALDARAALASSAWSADITRSGVLGDADQIALRVAQPLRVSGGAVHAMLPTAYDWTTQTATWERTPISLTPSGREIDSELAYSGPLAGGWIRVNSFIRRESGHIRNAPDDIGGAVRFTLGY